jgi:hypothetical protein
MFNSFFNLTGFRNLPPVGITTFSAQYNFAVNQNLILLSFESNVLIKKIELHHSSIFPLDVVKFFDVRFRMLTNGGALITENAGNIINPLSGAWNGTGLKNSDLDFVLSTKKNFIEFDEGIEALGFFPVSYSVEFYNPVTGVNNFTVPYLTVSYEKSPTNRNV